MSPLLLSSISSGWSCVSVSQIFTPLPKTYNKWCSCIVYLTVYALKTERKAYRVYLKCLITLGVLHTNTRKRLLSIYVWKDTVLRYSPHACPTSFLYIFLCVEKLWKATVFSSNWKLKRHFTYILFVPIKPFITSPGPLKLCNIPWSEVSLRIFNQVGHFLWLVTW